MKYKYESWTAEFWTSLRCTLHCSPLGIPECRQSHPCSHANRLLEIFCEIYTPQPCPVLVKFQIEFHHLFSRLEILSLSQKGFYSLIFCHLFFILFRKNKFPRHVLSVSCQKRQLLMSSNMCCSLICLLFLYCLHGTTDSTLSSFLRCQKHSPNKTRLATKIYTGPINDLWLCRGLE